MSYLMIQLLGNGGEGGIRTHGPDFNRDNRLAGDPDRPLQHLSAQAGILCYSSIFFPRCKTQEPDILSEESSYRGIG